MWTTVATADVPDDVCGFVDWTEMPESILNKLKSLEEGGGGFSNGGPPTRLPPPPTQLHYPLAVLLNS
jgi:hypothetical protein